MRWALVLLLAGCAASPRIAEFSSDGCSLFPDGDPAGDRALWCECCAAHDLAYWQGGTEEERKQADAALRDCVLARTGNRSLAQAMYRGVRLGGAPVVPTWYRWGYGWPYGRGYAPLTDAERRQVDEQLSRVAPERVIARVCAGAGALARRR